MVAETVFGTILIIFAVCTGVGLPLLALHFQQREVHERNLVAEVEHQKDVASVMVDTVEAYHEVTKIPPEAVAPDHSVVLRSR